MQNFYKFLQQNIRYPAEAVTNKAPGEVFVGFVVNKDGSLTDIKVLRGIGKGCDEEAIRVVKYLQNGVLEHKMGNRLGFSIRFR